MKIKDEKVDKANWDNPLITWKGEKKLGGSCRSLGRILCFALFLIWAVLKPVST